MKALAVIPTYNERDNLETIVSEVLSLGEQFNVLIVDDNSPDGTGELADELAAQSFRVHVIHRAEKQGLGTAYVTGFKYALQHGADYISRWTPTSRTTRTPARLHRHDGRARPGHRLALRQRQRGVNWSLKRPFLSLGQRVRPLDNRS